MSSVTATVEVPSRKMTKSCGAGYTRTRLFAVMAVTAVICTVVLPTLVLGIGGNLFCKGQSDMSDCTQFSVELGGLGTIFGSVFILPVCAAIDKMYSASSENTLNERTFTILASNSQPDGYQPV